MERNLSFWDKENLCKAEFEKSGPFFHLCTPEDYPVIFLREKDFMMAMSMLAIAFSRYPYLKVFAFEIMSNHIHILIEGDEQTSKEAFALFRKFLKRYLSGEGRQSGLAGFEVTPHMVSDLENLRNVIAYINRNAFIVNSSYTPYSYPWGTGRFYFNPEIVDRHNSSRKPTTIAFRRQVTHSHEGDPLKTLTAVDGYVTPLAFCDFRRGEGFFRDARQYFFKLSKNVEGSKAVADIIGEKVYYTDDELFSALLTLSKAKYDSTRPSALPPKAKIELARTLHYDYNAGNKQVSRMLSLDISSVNSLFPSTKP